jgi:hypothetical protein
MPGSSSSTTRLASSSRSPHTTRSSHTSTAIRRRWHPCARRWTERSLDSRPGFPSLSVHRGAFRPALEGRLFCSRVHEGSEETTFSFLDSSDPWRILRGSSRQTHGSLKAPLDGPARHPRSRAQPFWARYSLDTPQRAGVIPAVILRILKQGACVPGNPGSNRQRWVHANTRRHRGSGLLKSHGGGEVAGVVGQEKVVDSQPQPPGRKCDIVVVGSDEERHTRTSD